MTGIGVDDHFFITFLLKRGPNNLCILILTYNVLQLGPFLWLGYPQFFFSDKFVGEVRNVEVNPGVTNSSHNRETIPNLRQPILGFHVPFFHNYR